MRIRVFFIVIVAVLFLCFGAYYTSLGLSMPVQNKDLIDLPYNSDNVFIYIVILLIVIVLGFVLLRIIEYKNKQIQAFNQTKIFEQTINELKIDHQLLASRDVLWGEEKERGRISRDLHDGLGGLLSGIKLSLTSIKGYNSLPEEVNEKLDRAMMQLNASIAELRMIAQNLMPEALVNFGLKDALSDFCTNLGVHQNVEISFLFYGDSFRFDNSIETSLFRIAQEAVNNALKHAGASRIVVQLIQDDTWVNLTVQDNGKGFDSGKEVNVKSGGLKNIRARAASFDGRCNIDSRPGIGTEIIVECIWNREAILL